MTMRRSLVIALLAVAVVAACSPESMKESPAGRERQEDDSRAPAKGSPSGHEQQEDDANLREVVRCIRERDAMIKSPNQPAADLAQIQSWKYKEAGLALLACLIELEPDQLRAAIPTLAGDLERARNLQGKSSANEGAKPATQSDSPYRACVRQIIEDSIQRARAAGLGVTEQNAKDTEANAIFVCESTNGCHGEADCDRKMRHEDDVERRAIDRWK